MDPARKLELLEAEMRRQVRKEGISLDSRTLREIGQRVKAINESEDLEKPATLEEVLEIYLELVEPLVALKYAEIKDMIEAAEKDQTPKPRRTTTTGGIPGAAFRTGPHNGPLGAPPPDVIGKG